MKWLKCLMLVLVFGAASGSALARGHSHVGVVVDVPLWPLLFPGPYYPGGYYPGYYYPPAYYPPVVVAPAAPPVYVEQPQAPVPAPAAVAYWYHCSNPDGYYPYIKECPGGWQKVLPQVPPGQ